MTGPAWQPTVSDPVTPQDRTLARAIAARRQPRPDDHERLTIRQVTTVPPLTRTCTVPGCHRLPKGRRPFCTRHYNRNLEKLKARPAREKCVCSMADCSLPVFSRGLCATHYYHGPAAGPTITRIPPWREGAWVKFKRFDTNPESLAGKVAQVRSLTCRVNGTAVWRVSVGDGRAVETRLIERLATPEEIAKVAGREGRR